MRKIVKPLFATLLVIASISRADVLVYNVSFAAKITAAGRRQSDTLRQFYLLDPDQRRSTAVDYGTSNGRKVYKRNNIESENVFLVRTIDGKSMTLISDGDTSDVPLPATGFVTLTGMNAEIAIGAGKTRTFAPVLNGFLRAAGDYERTSFILNANILCRLNSPLTTASNDASESIEQSLERIVQHLIARGYIEEP